MLADLLVKISRAQRLVAQEAELTGAIYSADFEGTVTGTWAGIDSSGGGLVLYKGKTYKTIRLGLTSLFQGSKVQLSYVNGIYFSNW